MYTKNSFNTGFLLAFVQIALILVLISGIMGFVAGEGGLHFIQPGKPAMLAIIPGVLNVWFFFRKKRENSGRGALIATFIAMVVLFLWFQQA
ncbi:MAG: hypothetical protein EOL88_10670 [Bacteroidia bacterium]|nr:hypothetical protein [Bacteroidia bacterium]HPE85868.1 hypothetical protein [Bacteroidales bacterium]